LLQQEIAHLKQQPQGSPISGIPLYEGIMTTTGESLSSEET